MSDAPRQQHHHLLRASGARRSTTAHRRKGSGHFRAGPQTAHYPIKDSSTPPPLPAVPPNVAELEPPFLNAFQDAVETTSRDWGRFSLNRVQLRGDTGEMIGTDGKHLLIQRGYAFPWAERFLVPAPRVFTARELRRGEPVVVGRSESHFFVRTGFWTFHFLIDKMSRFPTVETVLQPLTGVRTTCRLAPEDARFLDWLLRRKQGGDLPSVTFDLCSWLVVSFLDEAGEPAEEVLSRSEVIGPPVRFRTDPLYPRRAIQVGFTEFHVFGPDRPVLCQDETRTYLWMPLLGP